MAARIPDKTSVVRIDTRLARAAASVGGLFHRKAAQQIEYWASLGRALETMPGVSLKKIEAVMTASLEFDALNAEERAIALARLGHEELTRRASPMKPAKSALYSREPGGHLIRVLPDGTRQRVEDPLAPARPRRKRRRA